MLKGVFKIKGFKVWKYIFPSLVICLIDFDVSQIYSVRARFPLGKIIFMSLMSLIYKFVHYLIIEQPTIAPIRSNRLYKSSIIMVNYVQISSYTGLQLKRRRVLWSDITFVYVFALHKAAAAYTLLIQFTI